MADAPRAGSQQLRETEEHFALLVGGVRDYAIFLLSPAGIVQSWNTGAERIKGYRAEDIIGKHFSQFYPPEALAADWPAQELKAAIRDGRFEDEGWRVRKDGTQFWANVVISTLYDPDGSVRGFIKVTRDLTERKAAEEALRQSEERFRLLVNCVKDYAIFMLDPEGRVATWNAGAERIKGYSATEIIGQHFSRFYSSEDIASGKPERELQIARERGSVEDEGWRVRKDRSLFWANVIITAIYDDQKQLLGFAKVTRDMTEKRKAEALEVADRQKNEFLAMLAHELRNPLAPISNGLQLLRMPNVDTSLVTETTQMMERQVFHLIRLVDDLLDVSRIITGKLTFRKESIDLAGVIRHAIEEAQPQIDAGGHELMLQLPARSIIVEADAARLSQVVANLLVNAARYTKQPSRIWLTVERQADEAVIKVKDSGIGISKELLPRIFSLFVQAEHSLERSQGGLGIGLTIVKRIVEMHGGTVSAASAGAGQGSEFTVRLPMSEALAPVASATGMSQPVQPKRRILIVDDNVDAAMITSALLKAWGHKVEIAFNGPAGIAAVQSFRPEIILLDIGLPGMSGYEVAQQLRAEPSTASLIIAALTGYGQESDRRRSFEYGFDYHLTKPADPQSLESLLLSPRRRKVVNGGGENN
jgi:PAS domain S-box-containing protein